MRNKKNRQTTRRRRYTKKHRAKHEEETRRRIVEAAVALHQDQGGDATITEIARRAGVARVTVYRHFPDELALLTACTTHYLSLNPLPDLAHWTSIADPIVRLRTGLTETYAYHRQTERMMTRSEQEVRTNPVLADLMEPLNAYWTTAQAVLSQGWKIPKKAEDLLSASLGLALSLSAWQTLTSRQGLDDAQCVELFVDMIRHGIGATPG